MKNLLNWLFPNYTVYAVKLGDWTHNGICWETCTYEILYSKRLNKYKLKMSGYKAKKHPMYIIAVKYVNYLNGQNNSV